MRRLLFTLTALVFATEAFAQVDVVAKYRASFPTPLTVDQKVTLLRAVAAEVHGGLLVKHDGNNCNGYACDIICFSASALFDVLQAEEAAAIPTWNATSNPRGYACELVTAAPGDPPPVIVPPPPAPSVVIDYDKIAALITADGELTRAKVDDPNWLEKILGNRYVQIALTGIGTYFATHQLTK